MGMLIEQYVGKAGRRMFLLFCWLFTLLVLAAFADIIANTFNGMTKAGEPNVPGAQAAMISMLYIFVAMGFGCFIRKVNPSGIVKFLAAVVLVIGMFAVGMEFPLYFDAQTWRYVTFGYCFIASVLPMWLLMEGLSQRIPASWHGRWRCCGRARRKPCSQHAGVCGL